ALSFTRIAPTDQRKKMCWIHEATPIGRVFIATTGRGTTRPDLCANFTCENGGSCIIDDHDHAAHCICQTGYGGVHCERELTKCEEFPEPLECLNGGTCMVTNRTQYCECSIAFSGTNCEVFGVSDTLLENF
ncbi:EGF-like domain protein, partial [Ostertagia ostertagi]